MMNEIEIIVTFLPVRKRGYMIIMEIDYFRWGNNHEKVLLLLFVLVIGFSLSACSQSSDASEKEKPKEKKSQEELEKELDKELKKAVSRRSKR